MGKTANLVKDNPFVGWLDDEIMTALMEIEKPLDKVCVLLSELEKLDKGHIFLQKINGELNPKEILEKASEVLRYKLYEL